MTNQTTEPASERAELNWKVTMTCCGRDAGVAYFDTWEEADQFRNDYTSGPGVHPNGYSAPSDASGHKRSALIERTTMLAAKPVRDGELPPLPTPEICLPWRHNDSKGDVICSAFTADQMRDYARAALLSATPAREWVGLTGDELLSAAKNSGLSWHIGRDVLAHFARAVESKLREKNAATPAAGGGDAVAIIEKLWSIIDDIDTYGDMAKSDDRLYRSLVERRQKDRWATGIMTDGYTLKIPNTHPQPSALPDEVVKDAERLDFMVQRGYYIGWNRDGEACRVFGVIDEEAGFEPLSGSAYFDSARAAIDAAMLKEGK